MSLPVYPASSASSAVRGLGFTVVKRPAFNSINQVGPNFDSLRIAQTKNPQWLWTLLYEVLFNQANNINVGSAYTDLNNLMGFFLQMQGQYGTFLFDDPDDDVVTPAVLTAGWVANTYYPVNASLLVSGHWQLATVAGVSGATAPTFSTSGGSVTEAGSTLTWTDQGSGYSAVPNMFAQLPYVTDGNGNYFSPIQRNLGGFEEDITDLNPSKLALSVYGNAVLQAGYHYTVAGPGLALPGASYMGMYLQWSNDYALPTQPITAQFGYYFRVRFNSDEQDFEKFVYDLWTIGGEEGKNGKGQLELITDRPPNV